MEEVFMNTLKKYGLIKKNTHVLAALSGGADSVALLHLICSIRESYNLHITAVHINHGLRGQDADNDEAYCSELCRNLNVKLFVRKVKVPEEAKKYHLTEEEAGRKLRYSIFYELSEDLDADVIAVAHNKNDLAETALMNFLRGAGLKGIASIPIQRGKIVRPLLFISRAEIEDYCSRHALDFRTDLSNQEIRYRRNLIRHELMPLLENYNPNLTETLARTSLIVSEEEEFLDELAQDAFDRIAAKDGEKLKLSLGKMREEPLVLRRRILRKALLSFSKEFHDVYFSHINILLELLEKGSGKKVNMPGNLTVYLEFDNLCFSVVKETPGYSYELKPEQAVFVPEAGYYALASMYPDFKKEGLLYSQAFCCDALSGGIQIRTRNKGDRMYSPGNKKLKDYMINKKIPLSDRNSTALIASGQTVLWVIGYGTPQKYNAEESEGKIIYIYLWRDENERHPGDDFRRRNKKKNTGYSGGD